MLSLHLRTMRTIYLPVDGTVVVGVMPLVDARLTVGVVPTVEMLVAVVVTVGIGVCVPPLASHSVPFGKRIPFWAAGSPQPL